MSSDTETSTQPYSPDAEPTLVGNGSGHPAVDVEAPHRRWPWVLVGAALGAGALVAVDRVTASDRPDVEAREPEVELTTAQVRTQDLVEEVEWSGTLSAGLAVDVAAPASGVITAGVSDGDEVARGDVVVEIDGVPVVALLGDVPMWRGLNTEVVGPDVLQLETNLVALGFDPGGDVVIDEEYDTATAAMVELWEASLGLDATGEVALERVVAITGDGHVAVAPVVGQRAQVGQPLLQLDLPAENIDVVGAARNEESAAEVTMLAETGTPVGHGTVLARVDGRRVAAVVDDNEEIAVVLGAFEEGDVQTIEEILRYLGHDPDRTMTIDDEIDEDTTRAVRQWQESVGLPTTGSISPADYVVVPEADEAPFVVQSILVEEGDLLGGGTVMMQLSAPTLTVTTDVAVTQIDEFAVGDTVLVEQLDETTFEGVVVEIAEVADGGAGADAEPTISVTFDVLTEPEEFISGAVVVVTQSSRVDDAMVVPTRALVTLSEGGFAVERSVADGTTELVGVELGAFDEGVVEIASVTAGTLEVGDAVVVPS